MIDIFFFLKTFVCVSSVCVCMGLLHSVHADAYRGQKRALGPLPLDFQLLVATSCQH